ncbi:hypothetical protein ARMGADRAFT_1012802 [Armillaria gallica]|uniref:Uncharacterized protein n=1 Tax=Armillaria gallica TaxID=47427 RepID=A0A2H3DQI4_ARMGA|nr:hypothetical protein ARMGADRAFT_1012802 [Armillaria gallica]
MTNRYKIRMVVRGPMRMMVAYYKSSLFPHRGVRQVSRTRVGCLYVALKPATHFRTNIEMMAHALGQMYKKQARPSKSWTYLDGTSSFRSLGRRYSS